MDGATMTSTLTRTKSSAIPGRSSNFPSAADPRHMTQLLSAGGERPRGRSTAPKGNELSPSHLTPSLPPGRAATHLPPMPQKMIGQHAGHHGLADRHRADSHTGVVAALCQDVGVGALAIDGAARR